MTAELEEFEVYSVVNKTFQQLLSTALLSISAALFAIMIYMVLNYIQLLGSAGKFHGKILEKNPKK